jgi:hypothetical protein
MEGVLEIQSLKEELLPERLSKRRIRPTPVHQYRKIHLNVEQLPCSANALKVAKRPFGMKIF